MNNVLKNQLEFQKEVTDSGVPNGCFSLVEYDAGCGGCTEEKNAYYNTGESGFLGASREYRPICKKKSK